MDVRKEPRTDVRKEPRTDVQKEQQTNARTGMWQEMRMIVR